MSRNPYLAATRPSSSFTRSSRSSKATSANKTLSSFLGRSRSSANLSGGYSGSSAGLGYGSSNSAYSASTAGTPSWQRSHSSTRLNRASCDSQAVSAASTDHICSDLESSRNLDRLSSSFDRAQPYLTKSVSSHNIRRISSADDGSKEPITGSISNISVLVDFIKHLQNYQKSRLQEPYTRTGQSDRPLYSTKKNSDEEELISTTTKTNISGEDNQSNDVDSFRTSSSSHRLIAKGQSNLHKSNSLDIGKKLAGDPAPLYSSYSLDRLMYKAETLTERELRKMFKELVLEFEQLRRQLQGTEEEEKQVQQDWIRKERQMQRKISELEEENKHFKQYKEEIQRLKDENCSLIRVVSKLTKQAS